MTKNAMTDLAAQYARAAARTRGGLVQITDAGAAVTALAVKYPAAGFGNLSLSAVLIGARQLGI